MLDPLAPTQDASEGGAGPAAVLAPGTIVDEQFRVERELGRGGMGAVFLARDLRLERDVALKLGNVVSAGALQRVAREAIALAKLQHPNVVVVHQVGMYEGRLYIAMEYVAGGNATQWRSSKPRSWREIALLYAAAGDGLAAAHAAGFVHRDFKPDNVLVGEDGRPRVADFGLVRASGDSIDPAEHESSPALGTMTQTGAVLGTPAYMPPEQLAGKPTDARTDQFALCVSVWEAFYGQRPHAGTTPAEIATSIEQAKFEIPAHARRVPRRLIAALRRGLSSDPADRWPSLAPLIAELRHDPAQRRRRLAIGGAMAAVMAAAVTVAVVLTTHGTSAPCSDGPAQLARVWNPERARALAAAFDQGHLGSSWPDVHALIDRYATGWIGGYRAACRAARIDGSESEALLDRRMLCLTRARSRFDSLLVALTTSREAAAEAATEVKVLPDLAQCADSASLAQQAPLPQDPVLRARVDAAARVVDRALADGINDWDKEAAAHGEAALAAARETAWPPLVAEAMWARAAFEPDPALRARQYRAAAAAALAAGDDRVAAWALADGAWGLSTKPEEADELLEQARALWTRLGKPADLGNRIESADSERLLAAGDPVGAVAAVRRANELSEKAYPDNQIDRAGEHFNLAKALDQTGDYDAAQHELDTAIAIATKVSGEMHPHVAGYLGLASQIAQQRGKLDEGVTYARRALAIDEAWFGKDDPRIAPSLNALGQILAFAGHPADARAPLERAIALDPDEQHTNARFSLGVVEATTGNHARAVELWSQALARAERDSGPDNAQHGHLLLALGISHRELGHFAESHRYLERALTLESKALGADAPPVVNAKIELSYTLVAEHRAADAIKLLEPALAVYDLPPPVAAELHAAAGKALWETGDRARARSEVKRGRDAYAELGDAFTGERDKADAWLAAHR